MRPAMKLLHLIAVWHLHPITAGTPISISQMNVRGSVEKQAGARDTFHVPMPPSNAQASAGLEAEADNGNTFRVPMPARDAKASDADSGANTFHVPVSPSPGGGSTGTDNRFHISEPPAQQRVQAKVTSSEAHSNRFQVPPQPDKESGKNPENTIDPERTVRLNVELSAEFNNRVEPLFYTDGQDVHEVVAQFCNQYKIPEETKINMVSALVQLMDINRGGRQQQQAAPTGSSPEASQQYESQQYDVRLNVELGEEHGKRTESVFANVGDDMQQIASRFAAQYNLKKEQQAKIAMALQSLAATKAGGGANSSHTQSESEMGIPPPPVVELQGMLRAPLPQATVEQIKANGSSVPDWDTAVFVQVNVQLNDGTVEPVFAEEGQDTRQIASTFIENHPELDAEFGERLRIGLESLLHQARNGRRRAPPEQLLRLLGLLVAVGGVVHFLRRCNSHRKVAQRSKQTRQYRVQQVRSFLDSLLSPQLDQNDSSEVNLQDGETFRRNSKKKKSK